MAIRRTNTASVRSWPSLQGAAARVLRLTALGVLVASALAGCTTTARPAAERAPVSGPPSTAPGPPSPSPTDVYAADRPNQLSAVVASFPSRVYVPNSVSNTVDVIDPVTMTVVDHFPVGEEPQHVVPSYDLKTLYVAADKGNTLTPIDPATGRPGTPIPVEDPYNLYFTPDGKYAIVVAERLARLDFADPHTFAVQRALAVPCAGVDHLDFSADGTYLIANGVWIVDGATFQIAGFVPTGAGAHGLYVSRDSKDLYVSNRDEGSIAVV